MSRYFSHRYDRLEPYVPGEQPQDRKYLKLNTNESPFPPSPKAIQRAAEAAGGLNLYSDPTCRKIREALADHYGITMDRVTVTNGSDEGLYFAFSAWCDEAHPVMFPDITYGFYPVYAEKLNIPYRQIPVRDDLSIDPEPYLHNEAMVVIANPNAPTGLTIPQNAIEALAERNPDHIVVIDEAYVDFGGETCIPLIQKYDNLLVIQTFSKSRSMAGARLGFAAGSEALIADLNTIRYSTNPYNVNSMTLALGLGVLLDEETTRKNCRTIMENRAWTVAELESLGFTVLPSSANFIFARSGRIDGGELYAKLKARNILIRHFDKPEISAWNRITIGTREQMDILLRNIREILEEKP